MKQSRRNSSTPRATRPRPALPGCLRAFRFRIGRDEFALLACDLPRPAAKSPALAALSPTERKLVELLHQGCSNAVIARLRSVSRQTVANQLASAFRKLKVASRRELLAVVLRDAPVAP